MSETLGKIEKPDSKEFKKGRKLFFVPLVFTPLEAEPDFLEIIKRYWQQVDSHLTMLEEKLEKANRIYHELVAQAKQEGLKSLEKMNPDSHAVVKKRAEKGAELEALEDFALLNEFMDWGRCLAVGLGSEKVFTTVYNSYLEAQKKRNEVISQIINETLKEEETGILFMREGHQIQFPSDIQIFYVSPPALDELRRWLREHEASAHEHEEEKKE